MSVGNAVQQQLTSCWTETGMDCVEEDREESAAEGVMQKEETGSLWACSAHRGSHM